MDSYCLDAQADLLRKHIRKHTFDAVRPVPVSPVRSLPAGGLAEVPLILIWWLHHSDCFAGLMSSLSQGVGRWARWSPAC